MYARNIPHEVYRFSPSGDLLETLIGPQTFAKGPDDAFVSTTDDDGRVTVSSAARFVPRPLPAFDLGDGLILSGVLEAPDVRTWYVLRSGGEPRPLTLPESARGVADVDRVRRVLYLRVTLEDGNDGYATVPYTVSESSAGSR